MCAGWGDRDTPLHVGCQPRSLLTEGASGTVLVPLSEELELEQQRLLSGCPFSSGMSWGSQRTSARIGQVWVQIPTRLSLVSVLRILA